MLKLCKSEQKGDGREAATGFASVAVWQSWRLLCLGQAWDERETSSTVPVPRASAGKDQEFLLTPRPRMDAVRFAQQFGAKK